MRTLVVVGCRETRLIRREGKPPFIYTARSVERSDADERASRLASSTVVAVLRREARPLDHDDRQAKTARGFEFRAGRFAAGILGDEIRNTMIPHESDLCSCAERPKPGNGGPARWQGRTIGLDRSDQARAGQAAESVKLKPSHTKKDRRILTGELAGGGWHVRKRFSSHRPHRLPGRPVMTQQRNAEPFRSRGSIGADARGARVGAS